MGHCPGVELAAECELSPRGEGANKTQHKQTPSQPAGLAAEPTVEMLGRWGGPRAWQHAHTALNSTDSLSGTFVLVLKGDFIQSGQFATTNQRPVFCFAFLKWAIVHLKTKSWIIDTSTFTKHSNLNSGV